MITYAKGICPVCQCEVPVEQSSIARQQEQDRGVTDYEIDTIYGDCIDFIVIQHDAWGTSCDGSGQIPQTLVDLD